ncbi:mitochondrial import inner membrane translocase subunit TIM16 [Gaertneriomyces sp. JEL0708]|nr:mitochondrial import inner membrane translocase subunit TIM16 [Gaertneriomyces sp. JEL0708]
MVNAAKLITQIAIVGTQILGRAFVDAYKQAAKNAAANAAAGGTGQAAVDGMNRKLNMTVEEASQILNVERNSNLDEVMKKYEHLFAQNDPKAGGSFYLQSKVYRAKERLEAELKRIAAKEGKEWAEKDSPSN